jgi:hypothetical protein
MKIEDLLATSVEISDSDIATSLRNASSGIPDAVVERMQLSCGDATVWLYRLEESDCWLDPEDVAELGRVLGDTPRFFIQTQHNAAGNSGELARRIQGALSRVCPVALQFHDGRIGSGAR